MLPTIASLFPGRVQETFDGNLLVTAFYDSCTIEVMLDTQDNVITSKRTLYDANGTMLYARDADAAETYFAVEYALNTFAHTFRTITPYRKLNGIMPVIEKSHQRPSAIHNVRHHAHHAVAA